MFDYFFLTMIFKIIYQSSFHSVFRFYAATRHFSNVIRCSSSWCKSDVTYEINSSDVTFNGACELSQPMGKAEFSCTLDKDIRVFYMDRQFLSHRCYLTQDRIKITCI